MNTKSELTDQQNKKFKWKKIIGPCIIILIPIIGSIWSSHRIDYVKRNGIWSIMIVDRVKANARGGTSFSCHYKFRGDVYNNTGINVDYSDKGKRFFLQIIPTDPMRVLYYPEKSVPSWFTLEAPPEGWTQRPTEAELRELQNEADSVSNMENR